MFASSNIFAQQKAPKESRNASCQFLSYIFKFMAKLKDAGIWMNLISSEGMHKSPSKIHPLTYPSEPTFEMKV